MTNQEVGGEIDLSVSKWVVNYGPIDSSPPVQIMAFVSRIANIFNLSHPHFLINIKCLSTAQSSSQPTILSTLRPEICCALEVSLERCAPNFKNGVSDLPSADIEMHLVYQLAGFELDTEGTIQSLSRKTLRKRFPTVICIFENPILSTFIANSTFRRRSASTTGQHGALQNGETSLDCLLGGLLLAISLSPLGNTVFEV